jgi:hypothetical protein
MTYRRQNSRKSNFATEPWEIHHGTPERTERSLDEQYTKEHHDTPPDADYPEVHPGTLEGHQEVMEEVHKSVPDAPHIGTDEVHPSTPEVHPELSPNDSSMAHSGVPARQDHLISTPMVHPGTPSEEDWELWGVVRTRWTEVEKMLADWKTRQALLSTPSGTSRPSSTVAAITPNGLYLIAKKDILASP